MAVADVMKKIKQEKIKFVDLRFTDTKGKEQHVSVPTFAFNKSKFTEGHAFDGSSIAGWKGINASDMLLYPDPNTANIDPFLEEKTLILTCNVVDPTDGKGYDRDPRTIANRAEKYLKKTGIGDTIYFGPEPDIGALQADYDYSCQEESFVDSDGIEKNSCNYQSNASTANCCE